MSVIEVAVKPDDLQTVVIALAWLNKNCPESSDSWCWSGRVEITAWEDSKRVLGYAQPFAGGTWAFVPALKTNHQ